MNLSEFALQPEDSGTSDLWISEGRFHSPLGDFTMELETPIGKQPDKRMLEEAGQFAQEFEQFSSDVADKVFEHYTRAQDQDGWLESCGVPAGLLLQELAPYIHSRSLVICQDCRGGEVCYRASIYIAPDWDSEHGIYLTPTPAGLVQR